MKEMFDYLDMVGNYDQRKVENTIIGEVEIDTAAVTDSDQPYETGINSKLYGGDWVIVEMYETKEDAIKGHEKWIKIMENPPKDLKDVSTSTIAKLINKIKK
jgi:hypothetical protein